jgi:hypothetical protein
MGETLAEAAEREFSGNGAWKNAAEKRDRDGKWTRGGAILDRAAESLKKAARESKGPDLKNATPSQREAHRYITAYHKQASPAAQKLVAAELLRGGRVEDVAATIRKKTGFKG